MNSNTHPPGVACLRAQALHALGVDDWAGKLAAVRAIDDAPIVDTERRLEPTRALPGRPAPLAGVAAAAAASLAGLA